MIFRRILAVAFFIGICFSQSVAAFDIPQPAAPGPSKPSKSAPADDRHVKEKPAPKSRTKKHTHNAAVAQTRKFHTLSPRRDPDWCENEKGGEKYTSNICKVEFSSQSDCEKWGGFINEHGECRAPEDCSSIGAIQDENGDCVALPQYGRRPRSQQKPGCENGEELNESNECVPVPISKEECERQNGYFSGIGECFFKEDCEAKGGKWNTQQNSCET